MVLSEVDATLSFIRLLVQFWFGQVWDVSALSENFLCRGEWWELTVVVLSCGGWLP